jgi:hypothetical protein
MYAVGRKHGLGLTEVLFMTLERDSGQFLVVEATRTIPLALHNNGL